MAVKKGNKNTQKEIIAEPEVKEVVQHIENTPVANNNEEFMKMFKAMEAKIAGLEAQNAKPTGEAALSYDEEVLDDWLDKPVSFFTWSSRYSIHGDKRRGRAITTPNGNPVVFNVAIRQKKRVGKEDQIVCVARHTSSSKSVVDFLRNHTSYGTIIFEDMNTVKGIDSKTAQDLQSAATRVRSMTDMQIVSMARSRGLQIMTDTQTMRQNLIKSLAGENRVKIDSISLKVAESASTDKDGNRNAKEIDLTGAAETGTGNINPY